MRKCKYRKVCKGYQKDSYYCNHDCDGLFCGKYREFLESPKTNKKRISKKKNRKDQDNEPSIEKLLDAITGHFEKKINKYRKGDPN